MDMVKVMNYSKLFITGCDKNTEWMLPFFIPRFTKHNSAPLMVFDFGMSPEVAQAVDAVPLKSQDSGWFKKPLAMVKASKVADYVCWLDTDCEIRENIEDVFDYLEPNKLALAKDLPWTTRHKETWHNTGVVAFRSRPIILDEWAAAVTFTKERGDQEILHMMLQDPMRRLIHITDLPRSYNTLRLDLQDLTAPKNIKVMHWTGQKGKEQIRSMMR
jgi:hypothetical protein